MTTEVRVLIVDDEPTVRTVLETLFGYEGCETRTAADGEAAVAMARSFRPHVVLLDVAMPGIDGFEVCRRIKSLPAAPRVVMVTGRSGSADRLAGAAAGADAYFIKPFSPLEVLRLVDGEAEFAS